MLRNSMNLVSFFKFVGIILFSFSILGCNVGPDYEPLSSQNLRIPKNWHAPLPHQGHNAELLSWWSQYKDPTLVQFIHSSINTYPDLAQAVAKIKQSQANLRASNSNFFPGVTGVGSGSLQKNTYVGTNNNNDNVNQDFLTAATGGTSAYSTGMNTLWELDLFGAITHGKEVSQARLDSSIANWNEARVSLAAQVASTYVNARACQARLSMYEKEHAARVATDKLVKLKLAAGFASRADKHQESGLAAQVLSNIAQQKSLCEQQYNDLVALTGLNYSIVTDKMKHNYAHIPQPIGLHVTQIPAQMVSQRPDIGSAERLVAASVANLGVAVANQYPSITLNGTISVNAGTLYGTPLNSWSFGPTLNVPLPQSMYLRSQVALAQAQYEESVAIYKSKAINAVREIENALVRVHFAYQREKAANASVNDYRQYFSAMNKKYQAGMSSLLELETVRINLINYEQGQIGAHLEAVEAWIALYKAVGGDWKDKHITLNSSNH